MAMMAPGKTASIQCDDIQRPMRASAPPRITALRAIPVAGRDSRLLNLSGAHGPFFTRKLLLLTDSAGRTGVAEVPGGERICQTL